jgi:hypothetical protein
MHFGHFNPCIEYEMMDSGTRKRLGTFALEKDIGVLISDDLKWKDQVRAVTAKANKIQGIVPQHSDTKR